MRHEKEDKLRKDFPSLDIPYCSCHDGWFDIIYNLSAELNRINLTLPKEDRFQVLQIKEKFGGLRYYLGAVVETVSNEVHDLIYEAESKSYKTCEVCGNPGKVDGSGWIQTICEECKSDSPKD